jgi:epoxyqueuosine reductase
MEKSLRDPGSWIEGIIRDFLKGSPDNTLQDPTGEKAFEDMIVGFSSGDDPLFDAYKEHVGPFHWTPWEIFTRTFPEGVAAPDELTVISWILPQREATKADNKKEERYPSERWARARIYGEEVNV